MQPAGFDSYLNKLETSFLKKLQTMTGVSKWTSSGPTSYNLEADAKTIAAAKSKLDANGIKSYIQESNVQSKKISALEQSHTQKLVVNIGEGEAKVYNAEAIGNQSDILNGREEVLNEKESQGLRNILFNLLLKVDKKYRLGFHDDELKADETPGYKCSQVTFSSAPVGEELKVFVSFLFVSDDYNSTFMKSFDLPATLLLKLTEFVAPSAPSEEDDKAPL